MRKVYITKHALSEGILVRNATISDGHKAYTDKMVNGINAFFMDDYHFTMEAAVKRAEEMRVEKIAFLERQLESLKGMKFEVKE